MFPHRNGHKYTWTSPDGQTHNQTDQTLIEKTWHSSILDVRFFRGGDSDTDHNVVVATFRERLALSKQIARRFDGERFNLRKLNELECMKKYQIKITNRSAALEDFSDSEDINRAWENVKENIKTSAKDSLGLQEFKQHKPWVDEECLGLLDQRKQTKIQWLQDPNQISFDNLKNVRHEANRHFKKTRRNI